MTPALLYSVNNNFVPRKSAVLYLPLPFVSHVFLYMKKFFFSHKTTQLIYFIYVMLMGLIGKDRQVQFTLLCIYLYVDTKRRLSAFLDIDILPWHPVIHWKVVTLSPCLILKVNKNIYFPWKRFLKLIVTVKSSNIAIYEITGRWGNRFQETRWTCRCPLSRYLSLYCLNFFWSNFVFVFFYEDQKPEWAVFAEIPNKIISFVDGWGNRGTPLVTKNILFKLWYCLFPLRVPRQFKSTETL